MKKGARMVETTPRMTATEDLASLRQIEHVFLNWCTQPAENPHSCTPLAQLMD
jgi:hypothetical protein